MENEDMVCEVGGWLFSGHAGFFPGIPAAGKDRGGIAEAGKVIGDRAGIRAGDAGAINDEGLAFLERGFDLFLALGDVCIAIGLRKTDRSRNVADGVENRRAGIEVRVMRISL